jgi:hypothetical protein
MRGVTIFGVRDDRIAWGRLYLEDVEGGQGIDQAVQHMARGTDDASEHGARPSSTDSRRCCGTTG